MMRIVMLLLLRMNLTRLMLRRMTLSLRRIVNPRLLRIVRVMLLFLLVEII